MTSPVKPRASVVIPAYNEAGVIGRCLDALFAGTEPGELDVVVVCNGCWDDTAAIARGSGHPVRVLELAEGSKPAALRAGDEAARAFPRLYLDADVVLDGRSVRRVVERLQAGAVAARPGLTYDSRHSTPLVRGYYRARSRMPSVLGSLWGAGVYGLSAEGRSRFDVFPDVGADDLWIDGQFDPAEIEIVDCPPVIVTVPQRSSDLIRVLRRTYRGKSETSPAEGADQRSRATTSSAMQDLRRQVWQGPASAFDAAVYAGFALGARLALAVQTTTAPATGTAAWERDNSSRPAVADAS
jgi:glycosyltransferase involved in cell wall biosynthesis